MVQLQHQPLSKNFPIHFHFEIYFFSFKNVPREKQWKKRDEKGKSMGICLFAANEKVNCVQQPFSFFNSFLDFLFAQK